MIKNIIKKIFPTVFINTIMEGYFRGIIILSHIKYFFYGKPIDNPKMIPIIINNYNRLSYLLKLIDSLTKRGYNNIYIIDNNSTYQPLLDYYTKTPYTVFRLTENIGYKALWETEIFKKFKRSYYVYTDSDLEIDSSCPDDFLEHFCFLLKKYPLAQKIGFGIHIDDLPNCYSHRDKVIKWEEQFWMIEKEPGLYRAAIDTTFALYRPFCFGVANCHNETYRLGFPYLVKHLPWYVDSENQTEEEIFYKSSISQSTHWSKQK